MISFLLHLPTWPLIRIIGILSFLFLTVGISLGISYSFSFWTRQTKRRVYQIHSFSTITGAALGMLHGLITIIDTYAPYSWRDLLIPFSASYSPTLSGLGTLSSYGMLVVILTTDLRNKIKRGLWLLFHMLSYPIYIMALIHSFFMGTDSSLPLVRVMYVLSIMVVLGLTAARFASRQTAKQDSIPAKPIKLYAVPTPSASPQLPEHKREA
ncbi:hypothetical protein Back11_50680 [Paenibacillus baekrokdamisoli]|uniref:Uncharacterized protein n=1 Tax=Paenibacillus baekrokdamisoli TaxID=1712516 RepID=A0A3G9JFG9_9BACL|nr:ferric reductase-like transmembrane domain-containing protein [Paenibacillus baekrokdamisoli]MBB3068897.1 putative ferric reductase [Paenibacillus baekrokdamisoli]BBH23723.1 hypothetical protein Back11_50680 [Paenibacillus baekrokdamisoli]